MLEKYATMSYSYPYVNVRPFLPILSMLIKVAILCFLFDDYIVTGNEFYYFYIVYNLEPSSRHLHIFSRFTLCLLVNSRSRDTPFRPWNWSKVRYYGEMPSTLGTLCACGGKCSLASGHHFSRSASQIFLRVRGSSPKSVLVFPVQRI